MTLSHMIRSLYQAYRSEEGTLLIYALAFSLLLGYLPAILFFVLSYGSYLQEPYQLTQWLSSYVPMDYLVPFTDYLSSYPVFLEGSSLFALAISFYAASRSLYSFLLLGRRYYRKEEGNLVTRLRSLAYFAFLNSGILLLLLLPVPKELAVYLLLYVLYALFSYTRATKKTLFFTTLIVGSLLLCVGRLFFFYIEQYSSYSGLYGPLSSLMVLFFSAYILAVILYLGFCFMVKLDQEGSA